MVKPILANDQIYNCSWLSEQLGQDKITIGQYGQTNVQGDHRLIIWD